MFKKLVATGGIVLLALFASPLSANAATYVPDGNITVSDSTPTPGQAVNVDFTAGSFTGLENVGFAVTGEGNATLAILKAATVNTSKAAAANGSVTLVVTLPSNATGVYNVTATGATSGIVGTAALTVVAASGLPFTGGTVPFGLIWIAAGALALGVILVVTIGIRRRSHAN